MKKSMKILLASIASLLLIPMMQFIGIAMAVIFFVLYFIYKALTVPDPLDIPRKYTPELNPQPSYFMTIKGHVEQDIPNIKPRIVVNYSSNTEECAVNVNWFAGIYSDLRIPQAFILNIDSNGNFKKKIALDKYLPGQCDWKISYIEYAIEDFMPSDEMMNVLVFFDNSSKLDDIFNNGKETVTCGLSSCSTQQVSGFFKQTNSLPLYKNYQLTLNIIKEQKNGHRS